MDRRRDEIDAVGIDFDDLCALRFEPVDHLLEQIAPDLGDPRGGVEIGKMSLRETEVAVEAVDQDFEGVLQRVKVVPLRRDPSASRMFALRLEAEGAQIGEQVAKDLELIGSPESNRTGA